MGSANRGKWKDLGAFRGGAVSRLLTLNLLEPVFLLPPFPSQEPLISSSQSCVSKWGFLSSLSFPNWSEVSVAFRIQTSPLSMKFEALDDLA